MPAKRPSLPGQEPLRQQLLRTMATQLKPTEGSLELLEYWDDPLAFTMKCFRWAEVGDGRTSGPKAYQRELLAKVPQYPRQAIHGPHSLGKTTWETWVILWFACTREAKGVDWKIPTTAGSWNQLVHYLWPEIHKWARLLRHEIAASVGIVEGKTLLQLNMRLLHGEAFGVASTDAELIEGAHATELLYVFDEAKRLDVATPIPTPSGWTAMGAIQVGDAVLDEEGRPSRVISVSPIEDGRPCSEVTFSDGTVIVADDGHLWAALPYARRQTWGATHRNDDRYKQSYEQVKDWRLFWDRAEILTTSDLRPLPKGSAIPTCRPLDLPEAVLPIDPYVLGIWLGDGTSLSDAVTSADTEVFDRLTAAGHPPTWAARRQGSAATRGISGLFRLLRLAGLLGNKHIPKEYLRASIDQRLELLRGLMDSDGTVMGNGTDSRVSFTSTRECLAKGVAELVRTFGWKVRIRKAPAMLHGVDLGPAYILRWSADICPFHIQRKAERWRPRGAQASTSTIRTVVSVRPVPSRPTRCIAVDSSRHLYLAGESFVPTHNSISGATWDAAEGAFAGAGADTQSNAYSIACSTPGEPSGRFYDICRKATGYEDWKPRHVTKEEAIAAGQISRLWADHRRRQWGATNPIYLNRVEGEFAGSGADTVIPLAWVEAAQQRWLDWKAKGGDPGPMDAVGVDVGRGGNQTALAPRHGHLITEIRTSGAVDTMQGAGMVVGLLERWPGAIAIIDVLGIGAGMLDRVREQGYRAHAFNAGAASPFVDASGELHFMNRRAEIWWRMRELLEPEDADHPSDVMLPNSDTLTTDLTEPHWKPTSGGKILVEPKEDINARIGRSTDEGDAVCMAFAPAIDEPKRPYTPAVAGVRRHFDYKVR